MHPEEILKQRAALRARFTSSRDFLPFDAYTHRDAYKKQVQGVSRVTNNKIACVILAGGQGTRLGWHGPKALFPIISDKTLLQIHLENMRQADVPVAIMCSPLNVDSISSTLQLSKNFGLSSVELFVQEMLPLLDREENSFLEAPERVCQGPDGNGKVFHYLARAGILQRWQKSGIEHIAVLPIDNVLARPLDPVFFDFHEKSGCDVTTACVLREDPMENVGSFARQNGKPCVVEYSEIDPKMREARGTDGALLFPLANINIFLFRIQFAASLSKWDFPWHVADKTASRYDPKSRMTEEIRAWKFETFLFDALPLANDLAALVYPREHMYAPLKNAVGDRSPETVRAALASQKSQLCYDPDLTQNGST